MKNALAVSAACVIAGILSGPAEAVVIDFNNTVSSGFTNVAFPYVEDGFEVIDGPIPTAGLVLLFDQDANGLGRASDYLGIGGFTSITVRSQSSSAFALNSLDLGAVFSTTDSVQWTLQGRFVGGGTITETGSAINLSTVTFDSAWSNLIAIDILASGNPSVAGAIDNIDGTSVPEPGALALLAFGLVSLGFTARQCRKQHSREPKDPHLFH